MLIVVHDWNIRCFCDSALDFEALWSFNVFKVDASKRFGNVDNSLNELIRIGHIDFNIKHIDICKRFEQQALSFHDWFARKCSNVTKTENGCTVGNNSDQISF